MRAHLHSCLSSSRAHDFRCYLLAGAAAHHNPAAEQQGQGHTHLAGLHHSQQRYGRHAQTSAAAHSQGLLLTEQRVRAVLFAFFEKQLKIMYPQAPEITYELRDMHQWLDQLPEASAFT